MQCCWNLLAIVILSAGLAGTEGTVSGYSASMKHISGKCCPNQPGVYKLTYTSGRTEYNTYAKCDSEGYIIFQKRDKTSTTWVNFNRTWSDYKTGFGNVNGEFWLGNDALHYLTSSGSKLKVTMTKGTSTKWFSTTGFSIGSETYDYSMTPGSRAGGNLFNPGRAIYCPSGERFVTFDHGSRSTCARNMGGGWWFYTCGCFFLNGHHRTTGSYSSHLQGFSSNGVTYGIVSSEMKIKPNGC